MCAVKQGWELNESWMGVLFKSHARGQTRTRVHAIWQESLNKRVKPSSYQYFEDVQSLAQA